MTPGFECWKGNWSDHLFSPVGSVRQDEVFDFLLGFIESRDSETGHHLRRTALRAAELGARVGWPPHLLEDLRRATSVHDLGKLAVPEELLRKPGPLTCSEFDAIRAHTVLGARMLQRLASPVFQLAREIALFHHERLDGQGYPFGLAGEQIPLAARIVSVVDVFDALVANRVYRSALSPAEALELMAPERGKQFDPEIFDCFEELIERPSWGSSAAAWQGELAVC